MNICLVVMPWQSLLSPSLPVGILHSVLAQHRPADRVSEYHGSLHWAEHLYDCSGGRLTPADYNLIAEESFFDGIGDWVFAGSLWGDPDWGKLELQRYLESTQADPGAAIEMRNYVPDFLDMAAEHILAGEPDVVGFTTTFMQNVPSLALAQELKRRAPGITVVFGGGNCDGVMGHALHRNFGFVDYVVRGEGEDAFPALLDRIESERDPAGVPGLCYRGRDGTSVAVPAPHQRVAPGRIPIPDFRAWQERLESSVISEHVEPSLVLESARGCWWGEKHHCTFCGLNGNMMVFLSKQPSQIQEEIATLVERHQILDIIMVDNIVDMGYLTTVMPWLAETGWDLRVHYEVKSNLRREQLVALSRAGVHHVQPGIENLSSHVLKLMDKGVTGAQNVRILRDCEDLNMTCSWGYLYGFPGEEERDYTQVIEQIPALVHLQPPEDSTRISLERFSPNFNKPEIGFSSRRPSQIYNHIYDLPDDELADLVYLFDTSILGIAGATKDSLRRAVALWEERYPNSRLPMVDGGPGGEILIEDLRQGWPRRRHRLDGWQAFAYRRLSHSATPAALLRSLANDGHAVAADEVTAWLNELREFGLIFDDGHALVALANTGSPTKMKSTLDPLTSGTIAELDPRRESHAESVR